MMHHHLMPRSPNLRGNKPGAPRGKRGRVVVDRPAGPDLEVFGYDPPPLVGGEIPPLERVNVETQSDEGSEAPHPDIVALGGPPEDAAGNQKWTYRLLVTMAKIEANNPKLSASERIKRVTKLTAAARGYYPEAARFDLGETIKRDAEQMANKKRAKAAAQLEKAPPAGGAKVIPIRSGS